MCKRITIVPHKGFVEGMPEIEYHMRESGLGHSQMVKLMRSPAHYLESMDSVPSSDMEFGTLVHKLILQPADIEKEYAIAPAEITKFTLKAGIEFKKANEGKKCMTLADFEKAQTCANSLLANPIVKKVLENSKTEVSAFAEFSGVQCKARFDVLNESLNVVADVKTTRDASEKAFKRSVFEYGYHVQCALYSEVYKEITGRYPTFLFLCVEKAAPYACALYTMPQSYIEEGWRYACKAMSIFKDCQKHGVWNGYPQLIRELSDDVPVWARVAE